METGCKDYCSYVIKLNDIIFVFETSYNNKDKLKLGEHLLKHGDGVRDIAFTVEDC